MFVWYIFFTDSYYNSPSLAIHLLENPTHLCGTVRSSRKFYCKEIVNVQLEKGTASFLRTSHDQRIIVSKYQAIKDKSGYQQKVVYFFANMLPSRNDTNRQWPPRQPNLPTNNGKVVRHSHGRRWPRRSTTPYHSGTKKVIRMVQEVGFQTHYANFTQCI